MIQRFLGAAQPTDLHAGLLGRAQAKMQAEIVLRAKTSAASHLPHLAPLVRVHEHARTDSSSIGFCSNQLHQKPGVRWRRLIAKYRRTVVQVVNYDRDAPGIEDVPQSGTPAAPRLSECRPSVFGDIHKTVT